MQHVHSLTDPHCVDRAEGVAPVILTSSYTPEPSPFQGLAESGVQPNWTTNRATPMSFWTGMGNSLKSFFDEPSPYRSWRFPVIIIPVQI
jgi:hypothetical protein